MRNILKGTPFSNALLAGFLTGIIAALAVLGWTVFYRNATGYTGGQIFMPVSIFLGIPIILALLGATYFLLSKYLHLRTLGYVIFCIVGIILFSFLTVISTEAGMSFFAGFRGMTIGVIALIFILAASCIPYLAQHPDMYE